MQLVYSNPDNTTIVCTLEAGETLGNISGPGTVHVPVDGANAEYAEILAEGYPIAPYVPPTVPVPTQVGRKQWYHQASVTGLITEDEAVGAMGGTIPPSLQPYTDKVPQADKFDVEMLLSGGTMFDRTAPTCSIWIDALGWDNATTEKFWTDAALIM